MNVEKCGETWIIGLNLLPSAFRIDGMGEFDKYLTMRQVVQQLGIPRKRILRWGYEGCLPKRQLNHSVRKLVVLKEGRVFLKRVCFGGNEVRTTAAWIEAFIEATTPE